MLLWFFLTHTYLQYQVISAGVFYLKLVYLDSILFQKKLCAILQTNKKIWLICNNQKTKQFNVIYAKKKKAQLAHCYHKVSDKTLMLSVVLSSSLSLNSRSHITLFLIFITWCQIVFNLTYIITAIDVCLGVWAAFFSKIGVHQRRFIEKLVLLIIKQQH